MSRPDHVVTIFLFTQSTVHHGIYHKKIIEVNRGYIFVFRSHAIIVLKMAEQSTMLSQLTSSSYKVAG